LGEEYAGKQEKVREEEGKSEGGNKLVFCGLIIFTTDGSNRHLKFPSNYFINLKMIGPFILISTDISC